MHKHVGLGNQMKIQPLIFEAPIPSTQYKFPNLGYSGASNFILRRMEFPIGI